MDKDTQGWLIGVPFETNESSASREAPVLSRRHKRELASVTGLVMASIAFFLTPLLLSSPQQRPELLAQSTAVVEPLVAPASAVEPQSRPRSTMKRGNPGGRVRTVSAARRKGPVRLFRAFVGNGRYRVQPFPTPLSGD